MARLYSTLSILVVWAHVSACSDARSLTAPSTVAPSATVEAPATVAAPEETTPSADPVYPCAERDHMVWRALIANPLPRRSPTGEFIDTSFFDLPSGERVFVDQFGRVFHVSGPVCA